MTISYMVGFIASFLVFLLITFLVRKNPHHVVYDEMQKSIMGSAYKYASIFGVVSAMLFAFLLDTGLLPMDGSFALMLIAFLTITVYIIYMIWKGAYFGVSGINVRWVILVSIVAATNLITGVLRIVTDGLPNGILTLRQLNLLIGVSYFCIVGVVLLRKNEEKEDGEV